jgi:hypothetical protein
VIPAHHIHNDSHSKKSAEEVEPRSLKGRYALA